MQILDINTERNTFTLNKVIIFRQETHLYLKSECGGNIFHPINSHDVTTKIDTKKCYLAVSKHE